MKQCDKKSELNCFYCTEKECDMYIITEILKNLKLITTPSRFTFIISKD